MVEISLSGSGEGPGGAILRGYSTTPSDVKLRLHGRVEVDRIAFMRSTIVREKSSRSKKLTSIVVTGVATVSYGDSAQSGSRRAGARHRLPTSGRTRPLRRPRGLPPISA
jgi:hypothetical protein